MAITTSLQAMRLRLFDFTSVPMRAFHLTWITFFTCFFGWFSIAPLMPIIRKDLSLTQSQIGNIIIASVSITILARLLVGWLCDKIGPRVCYAALLVIGSVPIMCIGFSHSYESFLLYRLAIGVVGASFVITQYHTSVMFAPNVVGTANATAAGWGNMGGGVALIVMPLIFAAWIGAGFTEAEAWRYSMIIPGMLLFLMAFVYYFFTKDTPEGNLSEIRKDPPTVTKEKVKGSFLQACKDYRVWILFLAYAACFGIEITIDNIAPLYFIDNFHLSLKEAGLIAGLFGMMNIFARALGGIFGDRAGARFGLKGRIVVLASFLFMEGIGIMLFSSMNTLALAIAVMLAFALFLKMSNGATYSVVPFINKKAIGAVSGIVGAGGNVGAMMAGFLFKVEGISYRESLFIIGIVVIVISAVSMMLSWSARPQESTDQQPIVTEAVMPA